MSDLLLASHRALLKLQRTFRYPSVFGQLLSLRVSDVAQQLWDLVAVFHPRSVSL